MASTYTNDLRLELIATGEAAATWGDKTNTNLTNIAAAFGYATQDGFAANADATTTVADGSADPARAMYFKVTSSATLTATRTLTIAPNTISRVMWIENATTGGQSIAISQGTGANVTIATGKTAVVYLDGAGSGAAVVDAMAGVDPGVTDTLAEVLAAGNATGGTDIAVSTGDDITFVDSSKAIFGTGGDGLEIYHDGSNSYIKDSGTGDLLIEGSDNIWLMKAGGSEVFLNTADDGAVTLYHNNAAKLATTATGIDITGDVVASRLKTEGIEPTLFFNDTTTGHDDWKMYADWDQFQIQQYVNDSTWTSRLHFAANGNATFTGEIVANGGIALGDNDKATFGASDDLQIYHDAAGGHSRIDDTGTGNLVLRAASALVVEKYGGDTMANFANDGAVTLYYDNAAKIATTATGIQVTGDIANASGDLTLDVAGRIILDADTDGNVRFSNSGILYGQIFQSTDMYIRSVVADKDLIFQGNDNGTNITALTLDMSDAGTANFNHNVNLIDDSQIQLGSSFDMQIFHSGGANFIRTQIADQDLYIQGSDGGSLITALLFDMSAAGAATFNSSVTAVSGVFKNAADATGTTIKVQDNADRGITITSPIAASAAAGRIATSGTANSLEIGVRDYPTALTIAGGSGAATFSSTVTSTGLPLSVNTSLYNSNASLSYYAADNAVYLNGAGDAGWLRLQASGTSNGSNYIDIFGSGQGNYIVFKAGSTNSLNLNTGSAVFNESGADVDFRVENETLSHALYISGSNTTSVVGINQSNPAAMLDIVTVSTAGADAIRLRQPASSETYQIQLGRSNVSNDGLVFRSTASTGLLQQWNSTEVVINDDGVDRDFRVESATNTHSLIVQGSDGNVGINGAPSYNMHIKGTAAWSTVYNNHSNDLFIENTQSGAGAGNFGGSIGLSGPGSEEDNKRVVIAAVQTGSDQDQCGLAFFTHPSESGSQDLEEAGRWDKDGNLLVGTTTSAMTTGGTMIAGGGAGYLIQSHASDVASGEWYSIFKRGASVVGSITQSGTTAVLYNTSSDQRLKENIVDAPSASSDIDAIQVRSFDWKADGSHQKYGMVAQELQTVAPEAVHEPKDADEMMGVDYSKLVPMLVKEIQQLRQRVAQLES